MPEEHEAMREALKRVAVALKDAGVPFALAGGYAAWVHGAPEPEHDVDFLVPPEFAAKAASELADRGLEVVQPPEDWLFKVVVDGATIDVLMRTTSSTSNELLEGATTVPVLSVMMPVLSATDVIAEKLLAMDEHYCDLAQVLPAARALREQVDWERARRLGSGHPFAEAALFLLERLEVVDPVAS